MKTIAIVLAVTWLATAVMWFVLFYKSAYEEGKRDAYKELSGLLDETGTGTVTRGSLPPEL